VVDDGHVVLSTAVFDYALLEFTERRERHRVAAGHPDPSELLRREQSARAIGEMRRESVSKREKRNRGGGPGGSGGVR
jgi:hypothetical protein